MDFEVVRWPKALVPIRHEILDQAEQQAKEGLFPQAGRQNAALVLSVATREFLPILDIWVKHAQRLVGCDVAILACDQDTADFLEAKRFPYSLVPVPDAEAFSGYTSATGFQARGLLSTSLKFPTVQAALQDYQTVILSDLDALILKNPAPYIQPSTDIAFQRDWNYPKPMVLEWGLAACSGFLGFRDKAPVHQFLTTARQFNAQYYSDQVAFNFALQAAEPVWRWPVDVSQNATVPVHDRHVFEKTARLDIMGSSADDGLTFQALPADAFFRHHWIPYRRHRLVVYHPTLRKDVALKTQFLSSFSRYGHYYARLRQWMDRG